MKWISFILILLFTCVSQAKQLRVAVIDTGLDRQYHNQARLCPTGHKIFTTDKTLHDRVGHGTNVTGLITKHAGNSDYCIILIKFFSKERQNTFYTLIQALGYANKLKPDIISLSGGGKVPSIHEKFIVKHILKNNIKLVVAAGNNGDNLDKNCNYFPACYDKRILVIGALDIRSSNRGNIVDYYVSGKDKVGFGVTMSGTSQATAIFTGKLIRKMSEVKK